MSIPNGRVACPHGHGHSGNQAPFIVFHFSWNPRLQLAGTWERQWHSDSHTLVCIQIPGNLEEKKKEHLDLVDLEWALRCRISSQLPGDADAASLQITL